MRNSAEVSTNAHVSVIGHIVADELRTWLAETDIARGFANRFLFALSRRSRLLPFGGSLSEAEIELLGMRLRDVVANAARCGVVDMTEAARAAWATMYAELSAPLPGLVGAVCARSEAQVIRLALIYALLDGAGQIDKAHLIAAMAVWEYCEGSARYIFGDATGNPVADTILSALKMAGADGLTRTDIHALLGRNQNAGSISAALIQLHNSGLARMEQRKTGGRPTEVWREVGRS